MVDDWQKRLEPEEYFSAEDFGWLGRVASYDRDDPERFLFADDGDAAEACCSYANDILSGNTNLQMTPRRCHFCLLTCTKLRKI